MAMETGLCGVWMASGGSVAELLSPEQRRAMLDLLPRGAEAPAERLQGPLWVAASPDRVAHDGPACLAVAGVLVSGAAESLRTSRDRGGVDLTAAGHYALAYADVGTRTLTLYREISGGERLFYARRGDLVLFSTSARPLRAHLRTPRALPAETATEFVLSGGVMFGGQTLFDGIEELAPGEAVVVSPGSVRRRRFWEELPPSTDEPVSGEAGRLWRVFLDATGRAVGADRRVAVSLSGGLDSSAVAACAVELLGPGGVRAFTYEYDEPSHLPETGYARQVCAHLGIEHEVVRVGYEEYRDALPEVFWRTESPGRVGTLSGQWIMRARMQELGFRKELSGVGLEQPQSFSSNDPYLHLLARELAVRPRPGLALLGWPEAAFASEFSWPRRRLLRAWSKLACLGRAGLQAPPSAVYYPTLAVLRHNGIVPDLSPFYPDSLRPLLSRATRSSRVADAVAEIRTLPLAVQLRCLNYRAALAPTMSLHRQKLARESGLILAAPSYFMYASTEGRRFSWRPDNLPGRDRSLLRDALKGRLPDAVLTRTKVVGQAVPHAWRERVLRELSPLVRGALAGLDGFQELDLDALERCFPRTLLPLGLWQRIFSGAGFDSGPPRWSDL